MNKVTFPLKQRMQGSAVANLQDALKMMLERKAIKPADPRVRLALLSGLTSERATQSYGGNTSNVVKAFQEERRLRVSGEVDESTAAAINKQLQEWGELNETSAQRPYVVNGVVKREDGLLMQGVQVCAYQQINRTSIRLGEAATDAKGRYTIRYEPLSEDAGVSLQVAALDKYGKSLVTSKVAVNAKPFEVIDLTVPVAEQISVQRRIEGRIILEHGLPAQNLKLRLYRREFGGKTALLAETQTLSGGQYAFSFDQGTPRASLEVRAVHEEEEILLSKPLNYLGEKGTVTVNLVAPRKLQLLDPEYQMLKADISPIVGDMLKLKDIQENEERQDLTTLNRSTGWDARLLALASLAARLSADEEVGLPHELLYGLLRAGMPSDKLLLAQVSTEVAEIALKAVKQANIIQLDDRSLNLFKTAFNAFRNRVRLNVPAPGSQSTYRELLDASLLPSVDIDAFTQVFLDHHGNPKELWQKARDASISETNIVKLQRQGKLAFLAGNSAKMTRHLMKTINADPAVLAGDGFYEAGRWKDLIVKEVGGENLADWIPNAYIATDPDDPKATEYRLEAYAEDMARKIRLSYPTHIIAHKLKLDIPGSFGVIKSLPATGQLLTSAISQGFRLGRTPVQTFFSSHSGIEKEFSASFPDYDYQATLKQIGTLHRVYQITQDDESMQAMLKAGLTSAHDVSYMTESAFVNYYGSYFATPKIAIQIHRRARQVKSVTFNIATNADKAYGVAPFVMAATSEARDETRNELIKHYPTLEELFGSMDFCECEHCRSVLSPAAYLVDLLQFLENKPVLADNSNPKTIPYDVLIGRRPDIPHIALTCENTNIALPYIDVVNEILEYYVAHGTLTEAAANDTGEVATEDLLAEPQNVIGKAYDKLRGASYPLNLPFDLWLETAREFCNYFETPLTRILEIFRSSDDLFALKQSYDRASIFMESLGLSPTETAIFTDPDPLEDGKWLELFGYPKAKIINPTATTVNIPNAAAVFFDGDDQCGYLDISNGSLHYEPIKIKRVGSENSGGSGQTKITFDAAWKVQPRANDVLVFASIKSAKTLSRRLGVTYKELVAIIKTGFVNPQLIELELHRKLINTIEDIQFFLDSSNKAVYEQNRNLLEKKRNEWSDEEKVQFENLSESRWEIIGNCHVLKLRLDKASIRFNIPYAKIEKELKATPFDDILVLADPDASCNFDATTLQYASGRAADDFVFLKINLFVRLWRKLGWTIEETDRALQVFVPKNTPFVSDSLGQKPLETALVYLAHLKALDEKVRIGKQSRLKLITLWSDMATRGENALYGQLFLTPSMLKSGEFIDDEAGSKLSIFDDPLGQYLSPPKLKAIAQRLKHEVSRPNVTARDKIDPADISGQSKITLHYDELREIQTLAYKGILTDDERSELEKLSASPIWPKLLKAVQGKGQEFHLIKQHTVALQGALGLTTNEIKLILQDGGKSLASAELSLENISLLYRYGLLAKGLKLSVRELITLKQLSGVDPFTSLHPNPLADTAESKAIALDYPFSQTLRFVEIAESVEESGLNIEDLEYLLLHQFDPTGKYRPDNNATMALLKTLSEGVRNILAEHAIPDDPGSITEEVLRQKLGLVLPPEVVERFLAMMNGTAEFTAVIVSPEQLLKDFSDEPAIRAVSYNGIRNEQKLTYRGVLFDQEKNRLNDTYASDLLASLLEDIQKQQLQFVEKYLQPILDDYEQLFDVSADKQSKQRRLIWALASYLNPELMTDKLLEKRLVFVLPPVVAKTFSDMWQATIQYVTLEANVEPDDQLQQSNFAEPEIKVSYDAASKTQTLIYTGVLLQQRCMELKENHPTPLFVKLIDKVQQQVQQFYQLNLHDLFSVSDFDLIFDATGNTTDAVKRTKLGQALLPYIMHSDPEQFKLPLLRETLVNANAISVEHAHTLIQMLQGKKKYVAIKNNVPVKEKIDQSSISESFIEVSYDESKQEQTLWFHGVLLEAQATQLKAIYPSALFVSLLDDVQKQARDFYEKHLMSIFIAGDFNLLFSPIPGNLNNLLKQSLHQQKLTRLARAFMPALQQRLIRQFIIETMITQAGADPQLMDTLLTDERLLGDPKVLLDAFTKTSERGLSVAFEKNSDGSWDYHSMSFATADTVWVSKDSNPDIAHFEGYMEVPAAGAYRFYVQAEPSGSEFELCFDHLPEPIFLRGAANARELEFSECLDLRPGIPYRFSFDLRNLNGSDARLLVQSETLPKDSLSQLKLYPLSAIHRGEQAYILLSKVLLLLQSMEFNERETRYLFTHPDDFDGLDLRKLPTVQPEDDELGNLLFKQFLRLIDYKRLKRDLAGGADDLIGVFEFNEVDKLDSADSANSVYGLIAELTRRDIDTVKAASKALFPAPDFASERPLLKLWEVLQVLERFGVSIELLKGWTQIVSPAASPEQRYGIARDLKESVKARFEPETWRRVAQPIFNRLRQRQRDALVAHVMHQHGFTRMEQLYEYFLIDPGMEPVVQTSRIRLAIASVQLFVQRCLLSLEKDVRPSDLINADQWAWMKRYRVWEANRKIFLFPENWLEPEFRDDKTHLFQELEGALLQGDVSNDLVEDAFLAYLKKLDELARLDIVAMHCEHYEEDFSKNTLHVFGRTFGDTHQYFYRRYNGGEWSPWEPVTAEIEGDHLAPVVWRDRLYLFWVTFMPQANLKKAPEAQGKPVVLGTDEKAADLTMTQMINILENTYVNKRFEIQLHWSEYVKGEWSARESSGYTVPENDKMIVTVPFNFELTSVFIYVSKELKADKEGGVYIHLQGFPDPDPNRCFYLAGRNSLPKSRKPGWTFSPLALNPYVSSNSTDKKYPTKFSGKGVLKVELNERISSDPKEPPEKVNKDILLKGNDYTLLFCNTHPIYLWAGGAIAAEEIELYSLMNPIFYQDETKELTLYMEPTVTEQTIEEWSDYVPPISQPEQEKGIDPDMSKPHLHHEIPQYDPKKRDPVNWMDWMNQMNKESIHDLVINEDWVVGKGIVYYFDGQFIGESGMTNMQIISANEVSSVLAEGGRLIPFLPGSAVGTGFSVVLKNHADLETMGLELGKDGIGIVGGSGLNSALLKNAAAKKNLTKYSN